MTNQNRLLARIESSTWGYIPLLPIWLAAWVFLWPLTFLYLPDEATDWLLFFLGLANIEVLWKIIDQLWPEKWFRPWLLLMGVVMTTLAVHILGVLWLSILCPFTFGTAVYTLLETHELCYEGAAFDSAMLFGLMFGLVFTMVIFSWALWETFRHTKPSHIGGK